MTHYTRNVVGFLVMLVFASPALVAAQSIGGQASSEGQRIIEGLLNGVVETGERAWRGSQSIYAQVSLLAKDPVQEMPIPILVGVELRHLSKNFGDPRGGGTRSHEGLDIMAPRGTPIVSPTDAVVTRIGNGGSSGLTVSTANPGGERFVYMHLDAYAEGLQEGAVLRPGDLIGYVGNTGNASGGAPHLHFEIRKDGAQDPYPRLTKVFTNDERSAAAQKILATTARSDVKSMLAIYTAPVAQPTTLAQATGAAANTSLVRDLKRGMTGEDVRVLQKFLNERGFIVATSGSGSVGNETTYFGAATEAAVIRYQKSRSIAPAAGYFGPLTRASMALV